MNRRKLLATLVAHALLASAGPAAAHHSFAMYDFGKTIVLKGPVHDVLWSNPHVIIRIDAEPIAGLPAQVWTLEMTSPGNLTRLGWTRNTIQKGMQVAIGVNPLRSGRAGGSLSTITLPSGQTLSANLRDLERPGAR